MAAVSSCAGLPSQYAPKSVFRLNVTPKSVARSANVGAICAPVPVTLFVPIGEATQGDPASWIPFAPQMRQSPAVADPLRSVTPPLELAGLAIADESPAPSEKPGRVGSSSALICWACGWATSPNETAMKGNKRFTGILRVMRLGRRDRGRGGLTACEVWQTGIARRGSRRVRT